MGKRRLEDAIQKIGKPIEVTYRSFELDPNSGRDIKESMYEMLAKKYGMSIAQAKANSDNVERMAKETGLEYHLDKVILTNTFDAHRLTMFAKTKGLMKEMTERILRAYFTESKHIGDHATLTDLAVEVGLDGDETANMLASGGMANEVRADERDAQRYGISGVPFFLINKKYALSGAQPTDMFVQALEKVMAEDQIVVLNNMDGDMCDDEGCEIPK